MKHCVLCHKEVADNAIECECGYQFVGGSASAGMLPGEGMRIFAVLLALVSAGLVTWGAMMSTSVTAAPQYIPPPGFPEPSILPGAISNLALMQDRLMIYLGGAFCGVIAALLYCTSVIIVTLAPAPAAAPSDPPSGA